MSSTLRNCETWGCTYYEQSPGSRKCRSCALGIKRPLAGGAGAGAGAGASPTVQTPDFRSLFQTGARAESGLHLATAPGDINDHFPFLVGPDAARRARDEAKSLEPALYMVMGALGDAATFTTDCSLATNNRHSVPSSG